MAMGSAAFLLARYLTKSGLFQSATALKQPTGESQSLPLAIGLESI